MDYFDPYDFIFLVDGTTIRPANNVNFSYFNSAAFNKKITRAKTLVGVERYRAFSNLDQDLVRNGAPCDVREPERPALRLLARRVLPLPPGVHLGLQRALPQQLSGRSGTSRPEGGPRGRPLSFASG